MIRRCLAFALLLLIAGGCAPPPEATVRPVWRWQPPPTAYVGMPGTDARAVAVTYGHLRLVLLDAHGRVRWETERLGLRDVAPLLGPARLFAATDSGVAAFDRETGRVVWDVELGDRANTPVLAGGDGLAVTTWDGRVVLLDATTGALRHTLALPGAVLGPAASAGGTVVATWDDGVAAGVVALDATTGAVRWQQPVGADGVSSPVIAAGRAIVVTGDARTIGFALDTGRPRWNRPTSGAGSPEVPPFAARDVIIADRLGGLVAVGPRDGEVRWRLHGRGAAVRGGPVAAGPVVVMPVDDGRLVVRAEDDVSVLDPPGRVSGVAAGPDGLVVVATREARQNELVAYR
jgi:outer membrane protein assembly factor BamB